MYDSRSRSTMARTLYGELSCYCKILARERESTQTMEFSRIAILISRLISSKQGMDHNSHGFYQPNSGFHEWASTPAPAPMPLTNQWNMQQMSPIITPSNFIPVGTHFESDNSFIQTIYHHPPQIPTINFEQPYNPNTFGNAYHQEPTMMNQNPHQFGCFSVDSMQMINPYPTNQVNSLDQRDYSNTNPFNSLSEPRSIFEQSSPLVQPAPLVQPPPPLVQQQLNQPPQIPQPPQTNFFETPHDSGLFVPCFVRRSPPLPKTIKLNTNFQNNITGDINSDMTCTLTTPCSPKTSELLSGNCEGVRSSKSIQRSNIRKHEESAKTALLLKRKELKWKLMEASQTQNRAKLEEIRAEAEYNKKKMVKVAALASKLRNRFLKVAKASKMTESLYKKVELRLLTQEKFVADEKLQLTKLAVDCQNMGAELYGSNYKLTSNFNSPKSKMKQRLAIKIREAKSALSNRMIELEKDAYIHASAKKLLASARAQASSIKALEANRPPPTRLSPLYDLKNSILRSLASYRLTTKFAETGIPITDLIYTHNICANCNICLPDLIGTCTDKNCLYQHKVNYIMTDIDKLADILSYKPSLTGFKADPDKSQEENESECRLKLKQYAAKLLAKNSDKPVETIAQNLVKYVRANRTDHELLVSVRELPKAGHLVCNIPEELEAVEDSESTASDEVSIVKQDDVIIVESE